MDWIRTKAGLQMAETITRQLPRISKALEEIALQLVELNPTKDDMSKNWEKDKKTGKLHRKIGNAMISSIGYRGDE